MENQAFEGIIRSLDSKLIKMVDNIIQEGKEKAKMIENEAQNKLLDLKNSNKQWYQTSDVIISIKQELTVRKRLWTSKFNSKRANIIDKALNQIKDQLSKLKTRDYDFYPNLIKALFFEIKEYIGDSESIIHVTKGTGEFIKAIIPSCCVIQEDLSENGVILELVNHPIIIENTVESRFHLFEKEAKLEINAIFKDLEEPPWQESEILAILMLESMD